MKRIIADLHVHSGYSRATSRGMNVETMASWGRKKGINLLGTGDFTHPVHFENLKTQLRPAAPGLYIAAHEPDVYFMLTAEISSIYSVDGRVRKIHNLIFAPQIEIAEKINRSLQRLGNIASDGRPILGTPARDLLKLVLDISSDCLFVPAHVWTPWFSLFGSRSGFDTIEECFGEDANYIYALETGLSSDPQMNWRLSALDRITLLSNSDAHSPAKLGREANVFDCPPDYYEITDAIRAKDRTRFMHSIEFFPEEGKYHFDGHRACNVSCSPRETRQNGALCPVCRRPLTIGVMSRVEALADRDEGFVPENAIPARHLIPLQEIIAEALGAGVNTKKVMNEYERLVQVSPEFALLLDTPEAELRGVAPEKVAEGIMKVRDGQVRIQPGYDGEFGKVSIF